MDQEEVKVTLYGKIKKTVKHTLIFGIGSVVNSAFGIVLVPVYARHLKANEFGVLSLLTITMTLVTIVLKFGLNHAFFRHYYETEDPAHRRRIVGSTLIFLLCSAALFTALLYVAAPQVSNIVFAGESRERLLRLVFLISFFEIITLIPESILRARFKSALFSTLNIVTFAVQLFLISYLVVFVDASVENVLIGRLGGVAFEAVIFYIAVRRDLSFAFSAAELRGMLAFGVPLIFGQISFTLFMMIDRFFLDRYTTDREVGVYAMASTLVSVVSVLATVPFSQVWTVMRFSVMKEEGAEEYYARVLTYIIFISTFSGARSRRRRRRRIAVKRVEELLAGGDHNPAAGRVGCVGQRLARAQHRHHAQEADHLRAARDHGCARRKHRAQFPADPALRGDGRYYLDADLLRRSFARCGIGLQICFSKSVTSGAACL